MAKKTKFDKGAKELAVYMFVKLGGNNPIFAEINASTDYELEIEDLMKNQKLTREQADAKATHKMTPMMKVLRENPTEVKDYLKANKIKLGSYITAYEKDFPKWAMAHRPFLFVIKRGDKKSDYPEQTKDSLPIDDGKVSKA